MFVCMYLCLFGADAGPWGASHVADGVVACRALFFVAVLCCVPAFDFPRIGFVFGVGAGGYKHTENGWF